MIVFKQKGNFNKTEKFLTQNQHLNIIPVLERYGQEGVNALSIATPTDSGLTASSWSYKVIHTKRGYSITWSNSNIVDGVPIAVLLQYGHATRDGGYVQGRDYINPALKPIFDKIATDAWKEVIKQ